MELEKGKVARKRETRYRAKPYAICPACGGRADIQRTAADVRYMKCSECEHNYTREILPAELPVSQKR